MCRQFNDVYLWTKYKLDILIDFIEFKLKYKITILDFCHVNISQRQQQQRAAVQAAQQLSRHPSPPALCCPYEYPPLFG